MIYKSIFTYKEIFDIIFIVNLILSILNVSQKDMKNIKIGQIIISFIKGLKSTTKLLCEKYETKV